MPIEFSIKVKIWKYTGKSAWYFVTIDPVTSESMQKLNAVPRGWGSIRVEAKIGKTIWQTSVFPDKKSNGYLLPIKKIVRQKEELQEAMEVNILLKLLDPIIQ